jgi:hypothetical protein
MWEMQEKLLENWREFIDIWNQQEVGKIYDSKYYKISTLSPDFWNIYNQFFPAIFNDFSRYKTINNSVQFPAKSPFKKVVPQ